MKILIAESISGIRERVDPNLFPEGFAMLRTLADEFSSAGFEVVTPLNGRLKRLSSWINAHVFTGRDALNRAIRSNPDAALVIAPERKGELELITSRLRKKGIVILGAQEDSIRISGNKWLTYLALKGKISQPKTWLSPPAFEGKIIVKPLDGVGCDGVGFFSSEIEKENVIFQEFVAGEHGSCCLLMKEGEGFVLSSNKQLIEINENGFTYLGSEVPYNWDGKCEEISLKAASALNLSGFCGVDFVVGKNPKFIELNPRVTTSFIALSKVLNLNLGDALVDFLLNDSLPFKPRTSGFSIVKIIKIKKVRSISEKLNRLQDIQGLIAPPFPFPAENNPKAFVVSEYGRTRKDVRRRIERTVHEIASTLGVGENNIHWTRYRWSEHKSRSPEK